MQISASSNNFDQIKINKRFQTGRLFFLFVIVLFFNAYSAFPAAPDPVRAKNGMVVSASNLASDIGVQIMKKGGNAFDAAVAVGFALAVTYPQAGNLGGGGFMVIHTKEGKDIAIDFREKAPLSAHRDMYLDADGNFNPVLSQEGVTSAGVPGSVAGLIHVLNKYGTMKLKDVIQPAINLAEKGFIIDHRTALSFKLTMSMFSKYPSSMKVFAKSNGDLYEEGDLFIQKDLAKTLKLIRDKGADGFYKGRAAELLVEQVKSSGGYITKEDLIKYNVAERDVIKGTYRGYEIISMPPPSAGGIALVQMLNVLENYNFSKKDWGSSNYISTLTETMKYAYVDRTRYAGDEDFVEIPKQRLTSKEYADSIYTKIKEKVTPSKDISSLVYESDETTHYSVYDKNGNAASVTTTINSAYGSGIVVEGAGFLLNNEMDDFSGKPGSSNIYGLIGSEANSIQPGKRMVSSMTPTIVLKDKKPYLIAGSPGGSTIITSVLQVILNCLDFNMNIQESINQPRMHHQWLPDQIDYEKFGLTEDVRNSLINKGYKLGEERTLGRVEGIMIKENIIHGATDPRGWGKAAGF